MNAEGARAEFGVSLGGLEEAEAGSFDEFD